jgi:cytochrome b561
MTLSYLLLAAGIAVLINLASRWARIAGQGLAAVALFFNIWSIWLAMEDGTFAAATAAGAQVLALQVMGAGGALALAALLLLLPAQWRIAAPVTRHNQPKHWGQASRLLHWASAVLMLCALPMGLFVAVLPQGPLRSDFLDGHQGVGLAILALLVARLGWQLASPGPASPGRAARLNKALLYLLLLALPITGVALADRVMGVPVPALLPTDVARVGHQWLSILFAAAFAAHVGAVLWHQFTRRSLLIGRMLR